MKEYSILGKSIFYSPANCSFSFSCKDNESENEPSPHFAFDALGQNFNIKAFTFCINLSNSCNLNCDYCFNKAKTEKRVTFDESIRYLEKMFQAFPDGEKYYVDLSGKGEPLLYLNDIVKIAEWCKEKQNAINKEVLPQLVCNGTLLTKKVAKKLQKSGVLFGVSIDGDEIAHNLHRKTLANKETFLLIIQNIKSIKNKKYIGCATTLTKDVFPLLEAINYLSYYFDTLSFRPVRGELRFDDEAVVNWNKEYDRLSLRLLDDIEKDDKALFLRLMNGDDFFGRYLNRAFGRQMVLNRCDAGISRFSVDIDGKIYGCPALSMFKDKCLTKIGVLYSKERFLQQAHQCLDCDFKIFCGGSCEVEVADGADLKNMCNFKKHLILLANYLQLKCEEINPKLDLFLQDFAMKKMRRNERDKELIAFLKSHPHYSFTKGKKVFDKKHPSY